MYCCLHKKYHPGRDPMELKDCINNLTHSLLQQGNDMRQRRVGAPLSASKNLTSTTSGGGRSVVDIPKCPRLKNKKISKRSYTSTTIIYQCEECTVEKIVFFDDVT